MTTPFPFTQGQVLTAAQMNAITTLPINDQTASYTLLVGDVGKRVIMNVSTASTVTVNNSIFAAGDTIFIANKASNASVITAGAGVSINTSGSLSLAQYGGGTLVALSASTFTFFPAGGIGYGTATGGTSNARTLNGVNYTVLTFSSDDNLVVSKSGLFDVLLIGGGGGGGSGSDPQSGGGGGAGALVGFAATTTIYLDAATYAVDVGAGGAGFIGQAGRTSSAASYIANIISAAGGGSGGSQDMNQGQSGASGGGGASSGGGFSLDETFGNDGGNGANANAAGGGGGYASAGGAGSSTTGGAGGNGIDVSTFGTSATTDNVAAGGGGSGSTAGGAAGTGGVAGTTGAGNNATTAGSGGSGGRGSAGGNGASGKVFVRFKV